MNLVVQIEADLPGQYRYGHLNLPDGPFGFTLEWPTVGGKFSPISYGVHALWVGWSERFQKMMAHVQQEGHAGDEIHGGNFVTDSEGCTLLGKTRISPSEIANKETDTLVAYLQSTASTVTGEGQAQMWSGHTISYLPPEAA